MNFPQLPPEMQTKILSNFCNHCTDGPDAPSLDRTLYQCSLVSKTMRAIALPIMLHQPSLQGSKLRRLIDFIFQNTELAKHVKWIYYEEQLLRPDESSWLMAMNLYMVGHNPQDGPRQFLLPYAPAVTGNGDVEIQMLLSMANRIEKLCLRGVWESGLLRHLGDRANRLALDQLFPALHTVLIHGDPSPCCTLYAWEDRKVDCRFILEMAPRMQSLTLYGMGRNEERIWNPAAVAYLREPLPTQLREVQFLNSAFFGDEDRLLFLEPLLQHCEGLESFAMELRMCRCLANPALDRLVSPGDFVEILHSQKRTLRCLDLNYLDPYDFVHHSHDAVVPSTTIPSAYITTDGWYASPTLRSFPNLRELRIDEQSFCRHWKTQTYDKTVDVTRSCLTDIVPPSVQKLTLLVRPGSRAWRDIRHFTNQVANDCYPNLRHVVLVLVTSVISPDMSGRGLDTEPSARFIRKARGVKAKLAATGVHFSACFANVQLDFTAGQTLEHLSEDMESGVITDMRMPPFSSHAFEFGRELCSN